MALYFTHVSFLADIEGQLPAVLNSDNRMLIFYGKDDSKLPEVVLDFISDGKIRIKKLPAPLEQSAALIAYELGKLRAAGEGEYVLWGSYPFPEIFKQLLQYDHTISGGVYVKPITSGRIQKEQLKENVKQSRARKKNSNQDDPVKKKISESITSEAKKTIPKKKGETGKEAANQKGINPSLSHKDAKRVEISASMDDIFTQLESDNTYEENTSVGELDKSFSEVKKDSTQKHTVKEKDELSKKIVKQKEVMTKDSSKEYSKKDEEYSIHPTGELSRENYAAVSKEVSCVTNSKEEISETAKIPPKEDIFNEVRRQFNQLVNDICMEPVSEEHATSIMMAVFDSMDASEERTAVSIYKRKLEEYLPPKQAKYFFTKTNNEYGKLCSFCKT